MRKCILLLALLFIGFIGFCQNISTKEKLTEQFNQALVENKTVGLAGAAAIGGVQQYKFEGGWSDLANKTPFTTKTINRTASISKPITAIAIMQLVEQGKLNIKDPVSNYIPSFSNGEKQTITVEHLLQHTSGITQYKNKKEAQNEKEYKSLDDALAIFQDRKLKFNPGSDFAYTTYGYVVLGVIIEKASGQSYENYIQEYIFDVAGMKNTSIEHCEKTYENKSKQYVKRKGDQLEKAPFSNLSDRVPGGGIQSTVEDLLKLGDAIINNTLISEKSLQKMIIDHGLKKEGNGYGLGWYLYGENELGNTIGHSGAQLGCSSFLFIIPEAELVTVVLSNTSQFNETGPLAAGMFSLGKE